MLPSGYHRTSGSFRPNAAVRYAAGVDQRVAAGDLGRRYTRDQRYG